MFPTRSRTVTGVAVCVSLIGCHDEQLEPTRFTISDSAGIRIVESEGPSWQNGGWSINREPVLEIGGPSGEDVNLPRDAFRVNDGRLFISDEANAQVRVFSPQGQLLRTIGGEGNGPGEFQWIWGVDRFKNDSLMVYDYGRQEVSVFSLDGDFGRSIRITLPNNYWAQAVFDDSLIFLASPGESGMPRDVPGLYWDSTWFVLYRHQDAPADTLGRFPLSEKLGRVGAATPSYYLGPAGHFAVGSASVFWGNSARYEINEYDRSGQLVRRIRRAFEPGRVTPTLIDSFQHSYMRLVRASARAHNTEAEFARTEARLSAAQYASELPAFSALLVDRNAYIWAENYRYVGKQEASWSVFRPDGVWLGVVDMPPGLQVVEIGTDYVLGIWTDDDGVDHVRMHALDRTSSHG